MATSTQLATSYETDFYAWTQQQAKLLRRGEVAGLDLENLAEEIESLGRTERRSFMSAIRLLTQHLLTWQYQPGFRSSSWESTIREQRYQISALLQDNPSFQPWIPEAIANGYSHGREAAAGETKLPLSVFPETCPYTWEQLTDKDWLPE